MFLIELRDIVKSYYLGGEQVSVLKNISLAIKKGDFCAIMGPSGSGKSTLMNIIGMLDVPTSGEYLFEGKHTEKFTENELTSIRRKKIGFVFQHYNLLSRMTALDQVILPLIYQGVSKHEREHRALLALEKVGLKTAIHKKPNELSGGQQQRVSLARALVSEPELILADEPTGALDVNTGKEVMEILSYLNTEFHTTLLLITHEPDIASYAKKIIRISDGNIL
jgi:putative ABC transport system ATP-binding protein